MSIRIAVLGAGIMGTDHARIIARDLPGAVLQLVCDASPDRARGVANAFGAVDAITDPLAAIARPDVDAVLIASPDETHAPLALAAIAAGKPALCEKPLAPSTADCLKVIESETKNGRRFLQLGFMRRFDPSYGEMKSALTGRLIGKAVMMHNIHRNVEAPANFTGQMAITNSAPHEFDAARFVLDTDYTAISVFQPENIETTRIGAPVFMVLETASGPLVNIEINNNATYGYDVRSELVGETGAVQLAAPTPARFDLALQSFQRYPADWRPRFAEAYRLQNRAWLDAIRTAMPSPIAATAWDGYCAARIAEAGVLSLAEKRRVTLPRLETPSFYR
ncbi:Gfo/Idh/MocA family oxidoreductase [Acidocella aminolytica]|uniref:Inositol 2-dehydrogenase n=1 Tax=Acidocella aminolytica 101 = DSM 11237 TaxID=1120923 RepID=A0A0D6PFF7_9PROT|nr:Gfo/Idh/MocA family oxidoreductase [Acidocella aminolytica]GAN80485.1 inositol 2-dehydrogenase [Acidocella aminolytica 101 = DSM 11237]SHE95459.1 myo-inositol 2-dehydrogenase / D-chiro-inositol 1-dehydrogenase [Acidocella aminolytica 101 = DSM 11237]